MSSSTDVAVSATREVGIWPLRRSVPLGVGIAYLVVAAVGRLSYALPRLVRDLEEWSAVDLKYRHNEVIQWFAGTPVYGVVDGAVYPPASHAILWPLLGWLDLAAARYFWAFTTMCAAAALALLVWRLSRPAPPLNRLFLAGVAFAGYPLQMSIFIGQLGMHVAAFAALGAFLLLARDEAWWSDALAGVLLAASLVKPTLSLPLVIAALIACRRGRPALLTGAAYGILTIVAAAAQPAGLFELARDWVAVGSGRVPLLTGVPNLHLFLARAGWTSALMPASLALLAVLAAGLWKVRAAEPWLLLAVAAIFTRIWAHSMWYDDGFLLLVIVALIRSTFLLAGRTRRTAEWLLLAAWAALLTPTWAFYALPRIVVDLIDWAQALFWLGVMGFLAVVAARQAIRPAQLADT